MKEIYDLLKQMEAMAKLSESMIANAKKELSNMPDSDIKNYLIASLMDAQKGSLDLAGFQNKIKDLTDAHNK